MKSFSCQARTRPTLYITVTGTCQSITSKKTLKITQQQQLTSLSAELP